MQLITCVINCIIVGNNLMGDIRIFHPKSFVIPILSSYFLAIDKVLISQITLDNIENCIFPSFKNKLFALIFYTTAMNNVTNRIAIENKAIKIFIKTQLNVISTKGRN